MKEYLESIKKLEFAQHPGVLNFLKNLIPTLIVVVLCIIFYFSSTFLYKKDIEELQKKIAIIEKQNTTSIVDRAILNVKTDLVTEQQKDSLARILDSLQRIEDKLK